MELEKNMSRGDQFALKREARLLIGIPADTISSEADIALQCAIDMGYRTPDAIAMMARKLMQLPDHQ